MFYLIAYLIVGFIVACAAAYHFDWSSDDADILSFFITWAIWALVVPIALVWWAFGVLLEWISKTKRKRKWRKRREAEKALPPRFR